ncbi:hypothetical protein TNCV_4241271 [Trichonephila clavipes]|nr:hypothetical protein TNCV_4241271 [Trichonephila clavipes]
MFWPNISGCDELEEMLQHQGELSCENAQIWSTKRVSLTKGNRFPIVLAKLHKEGTTYGFVTRISPKALHLEWDVEEVASAKAFLKSLNAHTLPPKSIELSHANFYETFLDF